MIKDLEMARVAISPVLMSPMASMEIAGTAAYCAAPASGRFQGSSVPNGATKPKGTGVTHADYVWSGVALIPVARTAVVDRVQLSGASGPAPRGRPV